MLLLCRSFADLKNHAHGIQPLASEAKECDHGTVRPLEFIRPECAKTKRGKNAIRHQLWSRGTKRPAALGSSVRPLLKEEGRQRTSGRHHCTSWRCRICTHLSWGRTHSSTPWRIAHRSGSTVPCRHCKSAVFYTAPPSICRLCAPGQLTSARKSTGGGRNQCAN